MSLILLILCWRLGGPSGGKSASSKENRQHVVHRTEAKRQHEQQVPSLLMIHGDGSNSDSGRRQAAQPTQRSKATNDETKYIQEYVSRHVTRVRLLESSSEA